MDIYIFIITILFALALIDLTVGVSNDAVNFLNSAIGSRVARRRTILIVASLGVMVGAVFSSGIMEVARKGIFNPEMFTFADVMIVLVAVMIADVFLLDMFNTFGLPTSTTVSIVFELLGAATAVAVIHSTMTPGSASFIEYINGERALLIISGIGLSVVIAFIAGTIIQFFTRLLFTFEDSTRTAGVRVVWSAIALAMITDFLFIKGLKGASFIPADVLQYVYDNTLMITAVLFVGWLVVATAIQRLGKNPLVFVVLAGTFALAMAFASNDLVNFIGVPLAGLSAWRDWSASGAEANQYLMASLREPVRGDNLYLLGAGIVMAITLWVSSKARSVTQTQVTLSRQDEGSERFKPGPVSRGLVRMFLKSGESVRALTPASWQIEISRRFEREDMAAQMRDAPAFDLVRASVNLAVASILIAIATSMKLPLSTTYVSFMVAMGTSLADRAWGRDSAAYRVAGVMSVLTGWFVTAAAAFTLAALVATALKFLGLGALIALVILLAVVLFYTHRYHKVRSLREEHARVKDSTQFSHQVDLLQDQMSDVLTECSHCVQLAIDGLLAGDRRQLDHAWRRTGDLKQSMERKELVFVRVLKRVKPEVDDHLLGHLEILACQQDLYQTVETIVENARNHVRNAHEHLTDDIKDILRRFNEVQAEIVRIQVNRWKTRQPDGMLAELQNNLDTLLTQATRDVVGDLYGNVRPVKFTTLLLTMLTELADFDRELERSRNLWNSYISQDIGGGA